MRCGFGAGYRLPVYKHVIKAFRRPSELKLQFIYTFCYDFVIFADTMSSYVVCKTNLSGRQHALECATFAGSELHSFVLGATVIRLVYWYGGESSRERKFHVTFALGTWERKFHNSLKSGLIVKVSTFDDIGLVSMRKICTISLGFQIFSGSQSYTPLPASHMHRINSL